MALLHRAARPRDVSLTAQLRNAFSSTTVSRGELCFRAGRVRITRAERRRIESRVAGSRRRPYAVVVEGGARPGETPETRCSCPNFKDGSPCKHIWATLICIDSADPPVWPQPGGVNHAAVSVHGSTEDHHEGEPDSWVSADDATERGSSHSTWRRQLQGIETYNRSLSDASPDASGNTETWYLLDVGETARSSAVSIDLCYRTRKKDGTFGKLKALRISGRGLPDGIDERDVALIEILAGNQLGSSADRDYYTQRAISRVVLSPAMHDILLPRLCASGRFVCIDADTDTDTEDGGGSIVDDATPLIWDDGEPWMFRMKIDSDAAGQRWHFAGELYREAATAPATSEVSAEQTVRLAVPAALLPTGLVIFRGAIAKIDAADQFAWIVFLRGKTGISIPYSDRNAFLSTLYSMGELPRVTLPEPLAVKETRPEAWGRLRIRSPENHHGGFRNGLFADVAFVYGSEAFPLRDAGVGRYDAATGTALVRDGQRERELAAQLAALDLKPPAMSSYFRDEFDFYFPQERLSEVVGTLSAAGWLVETDGVQIRRPVALSLAVRSGVDWFELDGRIDFGATTATLPRLLDALRGNKRLIRLEDGSQGVIPQEWVERYGHIARLGVAGEDHLRFSRSQALLLDALLAEQENVTLDRGFTQFRRKLASFDGIKPRSEPRGFQGTLRDYQKDGHGWLHSLRDLGFGGCLADDMGLGKTVQVLALLQSRRTRRLGEGEELRPSIVVVPKSLVFNWIEEAQRFTPQLRTLDYTGIHREQRRLDAGSYDILLTTYGTLRRDVTRLREMRFDYAILDEAQAIKNADSQAAKASRLLNSDHRLAMTGTPVENHLGELWSLFEFLNPGLLGQSRVFDALRKDSSDEKTRTMLARALRPFLLRRTKEEVLSELPAKTEQTLHCVLSARERQAYDELREYYRASLAERIERDGMNKSRIHVLEALLRLRQAACHPGLLDADRRGEPSAKLEALLAHVEEIVDEGHKALVFSQFTSLLAIVREELDRRGTVYEYLDGKTRDRAERVKRFQEDADCPLFLVSLKAGGQGLNLTAADYVYILDPWWNPAVEAQAVDRAHRIGQSRHVFAYRLIASDTVEEKIVELQDSKRALADAIVSGNTGPIASLTAQDIQLLLA
ncbi:MAG: helicase SNF2 [Myxococcales bacterium]|nr:MAG: helicase SNF2 [Myxococcales bacterium]